MEKIKEIKIEELSSENLTLTIVENQLAFMNKESDLKVTKAQIGHMADTLVQRFIDNGKVDELPNFLTIEFEAMESALLFGPTDVYVNGNSGQKRHTLKKLGVSRRFATAFKSKVQGFELKGMAPFKIVPVIPDVEQEPIDQLVEFCEGIKCDVVAINAIKDAFTASEKRTVLLRTEAEKRMTEKVKARQEQKDFEKRQNAINAFLDSGLTVADIQEAKKENESNEVNQATK